MKFSTIITLDVLVLLLGLVMVLVGLLFEIDKDGTILGLERGVVQNVLISVGCSIIASATISLIMTAYLNDDKEARRVIDTWGLKNIGIRSILNYEINEKVDSMSQGMDIIAFGMKNFLAAKGQILEDKVKKGCVIRILTINPESPFLARREKEENEPAGQIKESIKEMLRWAKQITTDTKCKGAIEVSLYNGLPQDMYQRIDDYVYVGPLLFAKPSQQTITYEYKPGSKGAEYYNTYFSSLWNNRGFSNRLI